MYLTKYILIVLSCVAIHCNCSVKPSSKTNSDKSFSTKINGLSFVASPKIPDSSSFLTIKSVNANWAALMPFAFMTAVNKPTLTYNQQRQWKGETIEGVKETALLCKKQHIKVMVKPQIWIGRGAFTGHIKMETQSEWSAFGEAYKKFILAYAEAAQQANAEMFCIGTELNSVVVQMPTYWDTLIADVKKIFTGQLTYAENWDSYTKVPFWKQLDYIGVDAYFPITATNNFTVAEAIAGWQTHKQLLAKQNNKKILFTEYGYRSIDFNLKEPWASSNNQAANNTNQSNALEALYTTLWNEPWIAGGFLWKWYDVNDRHNKLEIDYSPQGKPALEVVKKWYSKH
jgi:hypothetical protein